MKKKTAFAALVGAGAASIPYLIRQNTELQVTRLTFQSEKIQGELDGFRIVQVSDLHSAQFGENNCRLLKTIAAEQPDLIALTGDLISSYRVDIAPVLSFAQQASKIAPCYFVTGNHEHRLEYRRLQRFLADLEAAGVVLLRNCAVPVEKGAASFRLIGVDCQQGKTVTLTRLMQGRPEGELNVLLSHKPHYAPYYAQSGVDLVLTGHAHGGQFRLPLVGGLYAPGQGVLPKYSAGIYRIGDTVMAVSRGLGNSSFPIRIGNRAELVTLIFKTASQEL